MGRNDTSVLRQQLLIQDSEEKLVNSDAMGQSESLSSDKIKDLAKE